MKGVHDHSDLIGGEPLSQVERLLQGKARLRQVHTG